MEFFSSLLLYFNLIVIPIYCVQRIWKTKYLAFFNPNLHLLFWAYLYYTVTTVFMRDYSLYGYFKFSEEILQDTDILCNWFVLVFFVFYVFSREQKFVIIEYKPKKITYYIALLLTGITAVLFLYLIMVYGPVLIAIQDRGEALKVFGTDIFGRFKFNAVMWLFLASIAVIVWRTKNFWWYLLIALPMSLDLLAKGRTFAWVCMFFAYLNYIAISKKISLLYVLPLFIMLVATVFFRYEDYRWGDLKENLFDLFGDMFANRYSTPLVYRNYYHNGDLIEYLLSSFLKFLPSSIHKLIFEYEDWQEVSMDKIILEDYGKKLGYGLAVNFPAEALYYGGFAFAIISPIVIGWIVYSMYKFGIYKTFPGFIAFCLFLSNLRGMIRATFYDNLMGLFYFMFSYLIWITVLEWGRLVFKRINFSIKQQL